jgi:hypothetical protein
MTAAVTDAKAFVAALKDAGIAVDDVTADTKKLGEASYQAGLQAATIYEKLAPIEKANFEKVLKDLGFPPETIASIEKGSAAFKRAHDEAAKPFFTPEQQKSIAELSKGWDEFAAASKRAWAQVAGDAETGAQGWAHTFAAAIATGFADAMGYLGQFEHYIVGVFANLPTTIANAFNAILSPIKSVIDTIGGWIHGLVDAAKALWAGLTGGGGSVSAGAAPGMAAGGEVGGAPGVDRNLALLSKGEFVLSVAAVQRYGVGWLHSLNAMAIPRFAGGGLNGGLPSLAGAAAGGRPIHLHIAGQAFGPMTASQDVAGALERFAVHSQIASTGRKQSWRR